MLILSSNYRVTQPVTYILKDTKPTKQQNLEQKNPILPLQETKKRPHKKKKEIRKPQ